ncbi:bursicon-like [Corticium candelabrum]|uniref:bursicon-like n=1 Tax=Corticium candelabrum TaxID=121492 RepID=UPI002E269A87|nr:bursicon-like [Corticium candelabrum]
MTSIYEVSSSSFAMTLLPSRLTLIVVVVYTLLETRNVGSTHCTVVPGRVTVSHPGCADVTITATVCSGMCSSTTKALLVPPYYRMARVNCCSPIREVQKDVYMVCSKPGIGTANSLQKKTVNVPTECVCRQCSAS